MLGPDISVYKKYLVEHFTTKLYQVYQAYLQKYLKI